MAWINSTEQTILTCAIYLFASPINFSSSFKRKMQHNISDLDHIEVLLFPTLEEEFHPCLQKCEVKSLSVELYSYYNEIVMRWQNLLRQYLFIHKGSIYLYHIIMTVSPLRTIYECSSCVHLYLCVCICVCTRLCEGWCCSLNVLLLIFYLKFWGLWSESVSRKALNFMTGLYAKFQQYWLVYFISGLDFKCFCSIEWVRVNCYGGREGG